MRILTEVALVLGAVLAFAGTPARAATIEIEPPVPGPEDSVRVTVYSPYSMGCWSSLGSACSAGSPDTLRVTAWTQFCNGLEGCPCPMMPIVIVSRCVFGPLAPGTHVVSFTEIHVNPHDPFGTSTQALVFTVTTPTPALRRSWGTLKSLYR
jgi:hypothetical protein